MSLRTRLLMKLTLTRSSKALGKILIFVVEVRFSICSRSKIIFNDSFIKFLLRVSIRAGNFVNIFSSLALLCLKPFWTLPDSKGYRVKSVPCSFLSFELFVDSYCVIIVHRFGMETSLRYLCADVGVSFDLN